MELTDRTIGGGSDFATRSLGDIAGLQPASVRLSRTESRRYSLCRAIISLADQALGRRVHADASFELDVSQTIERECKRQTSGVYVPLHMKAEPYETRSLKNVSSAGAEVVFTEPMEFIDLLRNAMKVRALGARTLTNLTGPIAFPKQTGASTLQWTGEAPGQDVLDTDMTFGQVGGTPHAAMSSTSYTRNLLTQSSLDVESLVRNDLALINAVGIDAAAINGSGASSQPKGLLKTTGIGSVLAGNGTDGGSISNAVFVKLESALSSANVNLITPGYLTTPGIRGWCKMTPIISTFPLMIWPSDNMVNGYPSEVSNNVPSGLTKGAYSDCQAVIFGNWSDLIICEWGVLELIVDPYRLKKQGIIEVTSFVMVDVLLRYPVSFAACLDARAA